MELDPCMLLREERLPKFFVACNTLPEKGLLNFKTVKNKNGVKASQVGLFSSLVLTFSCNLSSATRNNFWGRQKVENKRQDLWSDISFSTRAEIRYLLHSFISKDKSVHKYISYYSFIGNLSHTCT